ncbi:uncharacterized protein LODBEIA_P01520 [Lodderomyces beijingensis]|uniref:Early meiotic induction protein 1 n=1 Tax=Lodderomyces beijingensis TaxID=1775926 RepID=A0ABP0ZEB8_9ASCO
MSKEEQEFNDLLKQFQDSEKSELDQKRKEVLGNLNKNTALNDYPSKLSIMTALDELIACFAIGGQVKNYYRYGSYDSCERQREKFWFALKQGSMFEGKDKPIQEMNQKELEQRIKVQEFFKKRHLEDKSRGSSEDVWDARSELKDYSFR